MMPQFNLDEIQQDMTDNPVTPPPRPATALSNKTLPMTPGRPRRIDTRRSKVYGNAQLDQLREEMGNWE